MASSAALTACSATDIAAQDPGCPSGAGPCNITKLFSIAGGCTLDFGARALTVSASGEFDMAPGTINIKAASLTVAPGGLIDGRGSRVAPHSDLGSNIFIVTTGTVTVQRVIGSNGRIDVSGNTQAGTIDITAGDTVTIAGKVNADQLTSSGSGGRIAISSDRDIINLANSDISASGGGQSLGGGDIDLAAVHRINLSESVDISGSDAGNLTISSGEDTTIAGVRMNGTGDGGSGGTLAITAGTSAQLTGRILAQGALSSFGEGGGSGGTVIVATQFGDLTIAEDIIAEGAYPDGEGGSVGLSAAGAIPVQATATLSVRGNGGDSSGGDLSLDAGRDIAVTGSIDASGGIAGGDIALSARGNLTLSGRVDSSGRGDEAAGGSVTAVAGDQGTGTLTISNTVDVTGGGCDLGGCGEAGASDLEGCNVTVQATGKVLARAPVAGQNSITTREQLTINGIVSASKTLASGVDGVNLFLFRSVKPPILAVGAVAPTAQSSALDTCTPSIGTACLVPCPTCGNGIVEYPETCDDSVGTPLGCDGCSAFCDVDGCSGDACSCDPLLGCRNFLTSPCFFTPTPTATGTLPPTNTPTITNTPEPNPPTATPTSTASATHTATLTPSTTATRTATAVITPLGYHDSVILPVPGVNARIGRGGMAVNKLITVKVVNADIRPLPERPGHAIRLLASDGDCPAGTVNGLPDFDLRVPGAQDAVFLVGGQSKSAVVRLRITRAAFTSFNRKAPYRCTLILEAVNPLAGYADPVPGNNVIPVEVSVTDFNDPDQTATHESVIDSAKPLRVMIPRGVTNFPAVVKPRVGNADISDVAGHAVQAIASDGDCFAGTVGVAQFNSPGGLPQNYVVVRDRHTRRGRLPLTIKAGGFHSTNRKSPVRCTAVLTAVGPSGDSEPTNNVTKLVIDVIDRNDF